MMQIRYPSYLFAGLLIWPMLFSCSTTISHRDIQVCRLYCDAKGGLHQIVIDRFKGNACHCRSSDLLWLNIGEQGTFEDFRDLGEEFEMFQRQGTTPSPN